MPLPVVAQSAWEAALDAVMENDAAVAVPRLEQFLQEVPDSDSRRVRATRYLAVMHEGAGRRDDARAVLEAALEDASLGDPGRALVAFDLATLLTRQEDLPQALSVYSRAISFDPTLAMVYLNRANLQVREERREAAIRDYQRYMTLRPDNPQSESIIEMIRLLNEAILADQIRQEQEEEARRIAEQEQQEREEEERRLAELQRQQEEEAERVRMEQEAEARRVAEAERQAREEEERRQAEVVRAEAERRRQEMLQTVLDSLGAARSETRGFELEGEDIRQYDDDLDILD